MNQKKPYVSFAILAVLYILLVIVLPYDQVTSNLYHLTDTQYRIFLTLISVPVVLTWFAAFYGQASLDSYASRIKRTAEGNAYKRLSCGLQWLAWGTPVIAIATAILGGIASRNPDFFHAAVIIKHYLVTFVGFAAFAYLSYGSSKLLNILRGKPAIRSARILLLLYAILAAAFVSNVWSTLQSPDNSPYFLPGWLIFVTVVVPVLYGWFMALLAVYELLIYSKHAKGLLYKRSLLLFYNGIALVIGSAGFLEYILLQGYRLRAIVLDSRFVIGYIALLLYALGFVLLAIGAQRLKRIEEV